MRTVLYVTAHPHDETKSYCMAIGHTFIEAYKKSNPNDNVVHLDLYSEPIPSIDLDVFNGWGKLQNGHEFNQLSNDEQAKVRRLSELCDQFVTADKYVFVTPMWNFSFPPIMKAYIDAISVAGKAFKYTEQGPVGLLTDKKALHIQSRGGIYSEGPAKEMEIGHRHLSVIMQFFGVPSFDGLFIEGHAAMPEKAEQIKEKAVNKAKLLAKTF
ncbi:FMN-dependent NADH-azoreductase [Bacillus kexueae]|uniref:FMN-dependent NADH-azoreductase n=1 Tax=Aeribacillus kexueae TaxID=2078952 RepID=UPI001FAFD89E|nr:FMN-dependent NADH-azoreductase [Bacillus kexueae]